MGLSLLAPLLTFLILGWTLEPRIVAAVDHVKEARSLSGSIISIFIWFLLAIDILAPIPSSLVCTTAGNFLGFVPATLISVAGFTSGNLVGWYLGRRFGRPVLARFGGKETVEVAEEWLESWAVYAILLSRPIPLFSEAVVLLLGVHRAAWGRWLMPLLCSNFVMAACWCGLGYLGRETNSEFWVAVISIFVPLLLLAILRFVWKTNSIRPR